MSVTAASMPGVVEAQRIVLGGIVQGVGFRPFVYRLARELGIRGHVANDGGRVTIHAEADAHSLQCFREHLLGDAPPHARPVIVEFEPGKVTGWADFVITSSQPRAAGDAADYTNSHPGILPDLPMCEACLDEMFDTSNRRYRYPFINCSHCGPRYSLIRDLPYDRANTSMQAFALCEDCARDYSDPLDRRFHAEPLACAHCGPALEYDDGVTRTRDNNDALTACIAALRAGRIVAVKGLGGYHLVCDASSATAVKTLRERKQRPDKPLAVLMDSTQLEHHVHTSEHELELLHSDSRPIVILARRDDCPLADNLAPGLNELGVMLPSSPLQHLLCHDFGAPLVATSANISGEPIITRNAEAHARLGQVCDAFLHHDRDIVRPADDPVVYSDDRTRRLVRTGRGLAPQAINLPFTVEQPVLAVGGHMKNTVALAVGNEAIVSAPNGDLGNRRSLDVFRATVADLQALFGVRAGRLVCDAHPGYASTLWAEQTGLPLTKVYHHEAHAGSLAADYPDIEQWLVFSWDGIGLGRDNTLWGGEALLGHPGQWQRVASLRPFRLPGAEKTAREAWRVAAALCWQAGIEVDTPRAGSETLFMAWQRGINSPWSSAAGRLFSAAASLLGLVETESFEGHGPMLLEALAATTEAPAIDLPLVKDAEGVLRIDWQPLLLMLRDDSMSRAQRARCFHESLAAAIVQLALAFRAQYPGLAIGGSGGVFQNRLLTHFVRQDLQQHGINFYLPGSVAVNDAGLCVGQLIEQHYA